jgi:hypothetical protein
MSVSAQSLAPSLRSEKTGDTSGPQSLCSTRFLPRDRARPPQLFGLRDPRKGKYGSRMQWLKLDRACELVIGLLHMLYLGVDVRRFVTEDLHRQ